jgi:hypothetical protein
MLYILNHSIYFNIVAKALHECFLELGVVHSLIDEEVDEENRQDETDIYIVFTAHEMDRPLPYNYIVYNFEQLSATHQTKLTPEFIHRLRLAKHVWDYSLENIAELKSVGIKNAVFVPFGYCRSMESEPVDAMHPLGACPSYDYLFTGCIHDDYPLRIAALTELTNEYRDNPNKILITNACWGDELVQAYRNAKIGLNIHFYSGKTILEVHRIIPLIVNRVWVLSETSNDPWYDALFADLVTFYNVEDSPCRKGLIDTGKQILALPCDEYTAEVNRRYEGLITRCKYIDFIRNSGILETLPLKC